jgi:hypothetical protein
LPRATFKSLSYLPILGLSEEYTLEDGRFLVGLARKSVELYVTKRERLKPPAGTPKKLWERRGAFVTLKTHPSDELRGCIGRPYPTNPLVEAVIDSAVDAAVNDPRFSPVRARELSGLKVEVSILTLPKEVKVRSPLEYKEKVKVGRDGIIIEWGMGAGLLLPQVPVEERWNVEEYLSYGCMKAGAPPDLWLTSKIKLYTFQAIVFEEESPKGAVRRKELE